MSRRVVKLPTRVREEIALALQQDDVALECAIFERILTDYANVSHVSPAQLAKARKRHQVAIRTARRLMAFLEQSSVEDVLDAHARGQDTSELQDALARRVKQWESTWGWKRRKSRPIDWPRRILLFRVMLALDDLGVPRTYSKDGVRVSVLQVVLRVADALNKRPTPLSGEFLRLIETVYKHRRTIAEWKRGGRQGVSPLHVAYEHSVYWPNDCPCEWSS